VVERKLPEQVLDVVLVGDEKQTCGACRQSVGVQEVQHSADRGLVEVGDGQRILAGIGFMNPFRP
jgi:hypothetical protein